MPRQRDTITDNLRSFAREVRRALPLVRDYGDVVVDAPEDYAVGVAAALLGKAHSAEFVYEREGHHEAIEWSTLVELVRLILLDRDELPAYVPRGGWFYDTEVTRPAATQRWLDERRAELVERAVDLGLDVDRLWQCPTPLRVWWSTTYPDRPTLAERAE